MSSATAGPRRGPTLAALLALVALLGGALVVLAAVPVLAATADVPTPLADNARSSLYPSSTLTPASAPSLTQSWQATSQAGSFVSSQPVVVGGIAYWGDGAGFEHATNVSNGAQVWLSTNLGYWPGASQCPGYNLGIDAPAVAGPVNGTSAIFVAGGTDTFYALNAATGAVLWNVSLGAEPTQAIFAAATLYNGSLYVPLSSNGDCPDLTQGLIYKIDVNSGAIQGTFKIVPDGCIGAGVWSPITVDPADNSLYFTTGNPGTCATSEPLGEAIVKINATTMTLMDHYGITTSNYDSDFGAPPTLFTATINGQPRSLVGASNKNGTFYAFDRTSLAAGSVWTYQAADPGDAPDEGQGAIAPAAWDGTNLYVGAEAQGSCAGTLAQLNPATGKTTWRDCLDGPIIGGMSLGAGVLATGAGATLRVFRASDGAQVFQYGDGSSAWYMSPPTLTGNMLLIAKSDGVVHALSASTFSGPPAVVSSNPAPNATTVDPSTILTATFNEPVNTSAMTFTVQVQGGGTVSGTVAYQQVQSVASFTPSAPLTPSTTFTATVSGATDPNAVAMTPFSWSFTTAAAATCPCFVQQNANHSGVTAALGVSLPSATRPGNRLVVDVGVWNNGGATAGSVSDTAGDTFTELLHFKAADGTEQSIWTAPITTGGSAQTVTVRPTSAADVGASVVEYAGLSTAAGTAVVDQTAHNFGNVSAGTTVAAGATAPTTGAGELALGAYVDSGFGDALSPGAGFAARSKIDGVGDMEVMVEDQKVGQGAQPNATFTTSGNTVWLASTVVLKAANTQPTAPAAPTNVTASPGDGRATVSWSAPYDGGSMITSYTVTPFIGAAPQPATIVSGAPPATTATVSPLTNGTSYSFTVTANNAVGPGPASAASNSVVPTAPAPPGAPTSVTGQARNASALVSWTAPSPGSSPITSYAVTPYLNGVAQASTPVTGTPPATSVTVTQLNNGTTYTFTVTAANSVGSGPESAPSNAVTPSAPSTQVTIDTKVSRDVKGTLTTAAFGTAATNELLVAYVGFDGASGAGKQSATVTGAGLIWTMATRANAQSGDAEIWWARASAKLSAVTVTATPRVTGFYGSLTVIAYQNASGVAGAVAASATSGAPRVTVPGVPAGGWATAAGADWDSAVARIPTSGQTSQHQYLAPVGDTYWVQSTTAPSLAAGDVTISDTAPTADQWNYAALAVVP